MIPKEIIKYINYNPFTGELLVHRQGNSKRIIPDENFFVVFTVEGHKVKIKYNKLIWFLVYGKQIKDTHVIYHKNLDKNDFRLQNLGIVTKREYKLIEESYKNLQGELQVQPHKSDAYSYVLSYRSQGRVHKETISDLNVARKKMQKLKIRYTKLLGKYILSE